MFHIANLLGRDQRLGADVIWNLGGWQAVLEHERGEDGRHFIERQDVIDCNVSDRAARISSEAASLGY
jgi:hypothetical protein